MLQRLADCHPSRFEYKVHIGRFYAFHAVYLASYILQDEVGSRA